ncbi:MAG TPA: DUF4339 domain-containing protein [Candidatus Methylacidiphilales bacterium]|nr:DUF4339 domain-containing protein [Candidatus Methylacidiphilales bacterium]
MVDDVRYYYSKDGTETQGPVGKTVLAQLFFDKIIDSESFICREGESNWQPLDPEMFQSRPRLRPALPGFAQKQVSSKNSKPELTPYRPPSWYSDANLLNPQFVRTLNTLSCMITVGGALLAVHLRYVVFADIFRSPESVSFLEVSGYFLASALFIYALPYLFSLFFRYPVRPLVIVITAFFLTPLALGVEYYLFSSEASMHALFAGNDSADVSESNAPWKIFPNGYIDLSPALRNLRTLRDEAMASNTDEALIRRDLITVMDDLAAKLTACNTAAAACVPFNLLNIKGLDDMDNRLSRLADLRDSQADLNNFLQNIVANCREAVARDGFSSDTIDEAVASFRKSVRTDQLTAMAGITMKISDDETTCLKILQQNWGRWQINNGMVSFDNPDAVTAYNNSLQAVLNDVQALNNLGKQ